VAYAVWSGAGIVLVAATGRVLYRQSLDAPAVVGIVLILPGVVVINVFSKTVAH
jgi:small multidrug resistance pump